MDHQQELLDNTPELSLVFLASQVYEDTQRLINQHDCQQSNLLFSISHLSLHEIFTSIFVAMIDG